MRLKHTLPKDPSRICGCRTCGEVFNGPMVFDDHRVGEWTDRRCLTGAEMTAIGWRQNHKGYWRRPKRGLNPSAHGVERTISKGALCT